MDLYEDKVTQITIPSFHLDIVTSRKMVNSFLLTYDSEEILDTTETPYGYLFPTVKVNSVPLRAICKIFTSFPPNIYPYKVIQISRQDMLEQLAKFSLSSLEKLILSGDIHTIPEFVFPNLEVLVLANFYKKKLELV